MPKAISAPELVYPNATILDFATDIAGGSDSAGVTQGAVQRALAAFDPNFGAGLPWLNIDDFGGAADGSTSGTTMNGTDNSAALNAAITAASDGQLIIIPRGTRKFATRVTLPQTKRLHIINYADCLTVAGMYFVGIGQRHHVVIHYGQQTGMLGLSGHSKTDFDNGTGMNAPDGPGVTNWNSLTTDWLTLNDTLRGYYYCDRATGYRAAFHFWGGNTGNNGGQEATFQFSYLQVNKYGIWLESADGSSYIDKCTFSGPLGGTGKIGGNQCIYIDGSASETGAARSNNFINVLCEFCNYGIKITGEATYNKFIGHRWEGGLTTGCFSGITGYINIKSTAVSGGKVPWGNQFIGCSHVYVDWLSNVGTQTTFTGTPIWNRNAEVQFASMIQGQNNNKLTVYANVALSSFSRSQLPANMDYVAIGPAAPTPTTDFAITRIGGIETIQKYTPPGSGGSSQWTTTGSDIYYNGGSIGLGVLPNAGAWNAFKGNTTAKAVANIGASTGIKPNPLDGDLEMDNSGLLLTLSSLRRRIAMTPYGGGALQIIRQNAAGTGSEFVDTPESFEFAYRVPDYSSTAQVSLLGGAKTLPGSLKANDYVILEGYGRIQAPTPTMPSNTLTWVITFGTWTTTFPSTMNVNVPGGFKMFDYKIEFVPSTVGTNVGGVYRVEIYINGNEDETSKYQWDEYLRYQFDVASGWNTVAPLVNLTLQASVATGFTFMPYMNRIRVKRQP